MEKPKNIKVEYPATEINEELDEAIKDAMTGIGYEMWASGYDLVSDVRDLAFEPMKTYEERKALAAAPTIVGKMGLNQTIVVTEKYRNIKLGKGGKCYENVPVN